MTSRIASFRFPGLECPARRQVYASKGLLRRALLRSLRVVLGYCRVFDVGRQSGTKVPRRSSPAVEVCVTTSARRRADVVTQTRSEQTLTLTSTVMRTRLWPPVPVSPRAAIGVVGGSGFYELADQVDRFNVDTPYGPPSGELHIAELGGKAVAFISRHGAEHTVPAHRVNFRANVWALQSVGVQAIIAPCSVGSLSASITPGQMVILDDLIDRTHGRADTYFDGDDGVVNHVTFGRPYDEALRALAAQACAAEGVVCHPAGTVVVINGPRFSTRAESRWFASLGASVVNMTQYPEAVLAAEMALPYCGIALVTDYDAGIEGIVDRAVTMEEVLSVMRQNVGAFRRVLERMISLWQPDARS